MSEAQLFESLGRKQAKLEEVISNYAQLITIVRGIKDGSIDLERLTIAPDGVWTLAAAVDQPEETAV